MTEKFVGTAGWMMIKIVVYPQFPGNVEQIGKNSFQEKSMAIWLKATWKMINWVAKDLFSKQLFTCSNGVYELPPGETSCFIYLNGPAAGFGVVATTGLTSVMSSAGVLGTGGLGSMVFAGQPRSCPPFTCRRNGRCCLFVIVRGQPRCPRQC